MQSLGNQTRRQVYLGEGAANRHDFYPLPAVLYNHINIHLTCLHSYSNKRSKVCVPRNSSHHCQEDSSQSSFLHGVFAQACEPQTLPLASNSQVGCAQPSTWQRLGKKSQWGLLCTGT